MGIKINDREIDFGTFQIGQDADGISISGDFLAAGQQLVTQAQGLTCGYVMASNPPTYPSPIESFSFASVATQACVGDMAFQPAGTTTGHGSLTHGYATGGQGCTPFSQSINDIQKFPFAAGGNAVDIADLSIATREAASAESGSHGYSMGGFLPSSGTRTGAIQKFPFSSDSPATISGRVLGCSPTGPGYGGGGGGASSTTCGYTLGGIVNSQGYGGITAFPFASDGDSAYVNGLGATRCENVAVQSFTHAYTVGGRAHGSDTFTTDIRKYQFNVDSSASAIGNITVGSVFKTPNSSAICGFVSNGGQGPHPFGLNPILCQVETFPFASDTNATCVGDLSVGRIKAAGTSC